MRPGAAALAALALAACAVPVPFADQWLFTTDRPQLPEARDCARCHLEIHEEWSGSAHANAWTSESFVAFTGDHAAAECLRCHAPAPLTATGEPSLRDDHRSEGVTCVSCHLSSDPEAKPLTMRGPHERTTPLDAHPIARDPLFRSAELCGTCHERVLAQWKSSPEPAAGEEKRLCQDCHMPSVNRTIESYDRERPYSAVFVALADPVDGRRHLFAVPETPWEDLEVEVDARGSGPARVRVTNRLPHAVPTGSYGRRVARLRVHWAGGEAETVLRGDLDQGIAAGASRVFEFDDVPDGQRIAATLERWDPRAGSYQRLAPEPVEPSAGARP